MCHMCQDKTKHVVCRMYRTKMALMTAARAEMTSGLHQARAQLAKVNVKNWQMATALSSACSTLNKLLVRVRIGLCIDLH
jgi:hypothetical protein